MAERLGNIGYLGLAKETTPGTAVTPTDWIPLYKETLTTLLNLVDDMPVAGQRFGRYQVVQGQRTHRGDFEVLCEPNTVARLADMILTQGSPTGSGPYTHPFTLSNTTNPASYTVDVAIGATVKRFVGVQASKMVPKFDKNELHMTMTVSALGSFLPRVISSVTGSGPYTINFDTTYDPNPTNGLVVGDLIQTWAVSGGTYISAVVATIPNGQSVTCTANVSANVSGDSVSLRPATPSFTLIYPPFEWAKTQFCFGATASAALSATPIRVEQGSIWELINKFESDDGALRSGGYDPVSLIHTLADATLKVKKFFDTPTDMANWDNVSKQACVVRMYAGATNQYELRMTFNDLRVKSAIVPNVETDKILYSEIEFAPVYSSGDGQAIGLTVINNLATV